MILSICACRYGKFVYPCGTVRYLHKVWTVMKHSQQEEEVSLWNPARKVGQHLGHQLEVVRNVKEKQVIYIIDITEDEKKRVTRKKIEPKTQSPEE